jgi:hypothetical protein
MTGGGCHARLAHATCSPRVPSPSALEVSEVYPPRLPKHLVRSPLSVSHAPRGLLLPVPSWACSIPLTLLRFHRARPVRSEDTTPKGLLFRLRPRLARLHPKVAPGWPPCLPNRPRRDRPSRTTGLNSRGSLLLTAPLSARRPKPPRLEGYRPPGFSSPLQAPGSPPLRSPGTRPALVPSSRPKAAFRSSGRTWRLAPLQRRNAARPQAQSPPVSAPPPVSRRPLLTPILPGPRRRPSVPGLRASDRGRCDTEAPLGFNLEIPVSHPAPGLPVAAPHSVPSTRPKAPFRSLARSFGQDPT